MGSLGLHTSSRTVAEYFQVFDRDPGKGCVVNFLGDFFIEIVSRGFFFALFNHGGKADHAALGIVKIRNLKSRDIKFPPDIAAKFFKFSSFESDLACKSPSDHC